MTSHVHRHPLGRFSPAEKPRVRWRLDDWLVALGADARFVADVFGDLAEGYAERVSTEGRRAASCWYGGEVLRSAPHVVGHTLVRATRRGTTGQRARLVGVLAGLALIASAVVAPLVTRDGPPVRFAFGAGESGAPDIGVVVNHRAPVRLALQVLDSAGHRLDASGVRYRWASGLQVPVSPSGEITCTQRGDAVVRATLSALTTEFVVHCEPLREFRVGGPRFVWVGETTQSLHVVAVGVDGRPITRLVAGFRVLDRGIATLDGQRIAPHRGGRTSIVVEAGGGSEEIPLTVVERVRTLAVLPPAGQAVGVPVRIAQDSVARWSLPAGRLWLQFVARSPARTDVDGAPCATLPAPVPGTLLECTVSERGASISIAATDGPAAGLLVLRRAF